MSAQGTKLSADDRNSNLNAPSLAVAIDSTEEFNKISLSAIDLTEEHAQVGIACNRFE